jgi:voltage-gated potassium channel
VNTLLPHVTNKRLARLRHRVYTLFESGEPGDGLSRAIHFGLVILVLVSVTSVILESVPSLRAPYGGIFEAIEIAAVTIFTAEYGLRLWSCVDYPPYRRVGPIRARLAFARTGGAIVDLLTIVPLYAVWLFPDADLRVLIVLRLLRFMKLARYSPGIRSLYEAVYDERRALAACLVILIGLVIATASLMHIVERAAQPEKFGTIPDAMWWAVITLATVGYGDVVPITPLGKILASATALLGLVMIALPVGIVATAFSEVIHRRQFVVTWGMIARVPLFADLTAEEVAAIMRLLRSQTVESGMFVVRRGEVGHSMYFIASGQVEIELPGGQRHELGEGQFFGEIAVLKNAKRNATVRATTRTQLLVLDASDLRTLMARRPDIAQSVREVARKRELEKETVRTASPSHDHDD